MSASRRALLFATVLICSVGLLAVLLIIFAQPPRPVPPSPRPATPTPQIVATVNDEPIPLDAWQRAVALDQVMSGLVGQVSPSPEETLNRLINERLVVRAAVSAGIVEGNKAQAEAWLESFVASWSLEETTLEQALRRFGLNRSDLLAEIVPRLLQVQYALEELPPDGDSEAWVAAMRDEARVVLLENLSALLPLGLPISTEVPTTPSNQASPQPMPPAITSSTGARAGEPAPDFSLATIDGSIVRLSDLRGKPVLLDFWASWCIPCREELLMLQAADEGDLVVLGIAVREPSDAVVSLDTELGLELPLLLDENGQVSDAYQVRGLPTSLFVDRGGLIVARHVGPLDQQTLDTYGTSLQAIPPNSTPTP